MISGNMLLTVGSFNNMPDGAAGVPGRLGGRGTEVAKRGSNCSPRADKPGGSA